MKNIVLNIPHSSTFMPNDSLKNWQNGIDKHIIEHCDLLADKIFSTTLDDISVAKYDNSRFFCDVERLENDPMEEIGQGIYYREYDGLTRSNDDYDVAMEDYYAYIGSIKNLLNEDSLLIDCHTFSDDIAPDIDVCIGFNEDNTKPSEEFLNKVKRLFESRGYKVMFNKPYSNSLSPDTGFVYKSMMIELNKKTYMSDKMNPKSENADSYKLNALINYLFKKILNEWNFKD